MVFHFEVCNFYRRESSLLCTRQRCVCLSPASGFMISKGRERLITNIMLTNIIVFLLMCQEREISQKKVNISSHRLPLVRYLAGLSESCWTCFILALVTQKVSSMQVGLLYFHSDRKREGIVKGHSYYKSLTHSLIIQ